MIMKKLIISLVVLAAVAGTLLAVTAKRTKTFAQENLEALAITEEEVLAVCFKYCVSADGENCTPTNTGYPFPITCVNYRIWP